ncbi:MAG: N-acetyltransferase [Candidatus Zixiibacteriota bacterium]|nr:MAG: N-acetyltransferase [candidate division Zixibacteria bacterium]
MTKRIYFVHDTAIVETVDIGKGTKIWAFCNVQKGAVIGTECNICDRCFIESGAVVGDRVTIKNGVSVWEGVTIENDVFIGPNTVFTNDIRPRSKVHRTAYDKTLVCQGATIGAGATIVAGHTIGRWAFIGAGAVVTRDVPEHELWYGNPARHAGYVCKCGQRLTFDYQLSENTVGEIHRAVCVCGLEYKLENGQVICTS